MDTKTYSKYWENITAYFSNDLSPKECESIENWADKVDGKELLMEIKSKMEKVENAGYMFSDKTDMAWNKLSSRIKQDEVSETSFFRSHRNFIGIAASIVILVSVGFGAFKLLHNNMQMQSTQTASNQIQLELADGTIVFLNGNSSIDYPSTFKGKTRSVKLVGEAYFDIKPDKEHPFIIETQTARIQVVGTSFNVRADDSKGDVEVFVTNGKVSFQDIQNPDRMLMMEKGDFASLKNNVLEYKSLDDVNYMAWQTKMLSFNKTPLLEVVKTLNRTYVVQIVLAEEDLGKLPLTSRYDQMEVDALLEAICLTFHLNQKTEGNRIILYSSTN